MVCPKCGRGELRRVARKGFLQEQILPLVGKFPWECPVCRAISLRKVRGVSRTRRNSSTPHTS